MTVPKLCSLAAGLSVTLLLAACAAPSTGAPPAGGGAEGGPKLGGVLRIDVNAETETLNPMLKDGPTQQLALGGIYNPLLRLEMGEQVGYTGVKILPNMAESWQVSPDATEYTFTLRKDLKWQNKPPVNGRAITAEDIKYNLLRFRDERVSMAKFIVQEITDVQTPDAYTVKVKTERPFVPFIAYMAWDKALFHPRELVEQKLLDTVAIGSGPFMLDSFQRGAVWHFKKNPDFFLKDAAGRQLPYIDGYDALVLPDQSTQMAAFVSGQVDVCGECQRAGTPAAEQMKASVPKAVFVSVADPGGTEIYMSNNKPPFNDVRVRQAMRIGLDPMGTVQALSRGQSRLNVAGLGTAYSQWALPADEVKALYPHDLAMAKQLLKDAGYANGGPQLIMHTANNNRTVMTYAELLQAQMKEIGFDVKMTIVEWAEIIQRRRSGEYQIFVNGKSQEIDPDGNLSTVYGSKGDVNYSRINDPQLDAMLDKQRTILDGAERKKAIQDIVRRIADQAYALNPVADQRVIYWQPYLKGYYPHMYWGWGQKFLTAWLDK